jgi:hypothetical protein
MNKQFNNKKDGKNANVKKASQSIDLDINNYTIGELVKFFKLDTTYSAEDLDKKEKEISLNIISTDNSVYDTAYKYDVLSFISTAKNILLAKTQRNYDIKNIQGSYAAPPSPPLANPAVNPTSIPASIGTIMNPYASHPAMQLQNIPQTTINGYVTPRIFKNYVFNSLYRDDFFYSSGESCVYTLPTKLVNVMSIGLAALQFPNVMFTFADAKHTTELYIYEYNTDLEAIVKIPEGNYSVELFPPVLEQAINEQVVGSYTPPYVDASGNVVDTNRFQVSISPYTNFTTILNTTNDFVMNLLLNTPLSICQTPAKVFEKDYKNNILPQEIINTLGYQIGFRQAAYDGIPGISEHSKSYTSEAQFNPVYSQYIYFTLDDYIHNQYSNTFGVLPHSMYDDNILAIIPVTGEPFSNTFGNNANFINKPRSYGGPVNISKIRIQLTSPAGNVLNLHFAEFTFVLQIESLYDNSFPPNMVI